MDKIKKIIKEEWDNWLLYALGHLFLWAGVTLLVSPYENFEVVTELKTLWSFKDLIGIIGILFSTYIFTKVGEIKKIKNKAL